jgi:hypothetical protein
MKRIIYFLPIVLIFANCQKMLHPEEISIGKITNFDQLVSATDGLYGSIAHAVNNEGFYVANLKGDDLNIGFPHYNSFYGYSGVYGGIEVGCWKDDAFEYISREPTLVYQSLFSTIVTANNILKQYNLSLIHDEPTKEILGEIYLIRAYCYFRLTRTYGLVPIIKNIEINYTVLKPTYTEIYNFIESDLKLSMGILPKNNSMARVSYVTVHRGTAKAILAELYLNWAGYPIKDITKYGLAAKEAGETIDSASYFGFGLLSDFSYVWDSAHLSNSESVFSVYFPKPTFSANGWNSNEPYNGEAKGQAPIIPSYSTNIFGSNPVGIYTSFYPTEINFYNNFPEGYRKEITFFTTIYVPAFDSGYAPKTGYIHIKNVDICDRIGYRKFYYNLYEATDSLNNYAFSGIPRVYIFRYAQTMLTYAEAIARSGQLNVSAYEYVNQIRRRAHQLNLNSPSAFDLPSGLSPTAFADSVVQERAWELCGEPEGRWFDLVRLEMIENLPNLRNHEEGGPPSTFNKSVYFSPIPAIDTVLNPNLGK